MLGLIIKSPWIDMILAGEKTWEIRGSLTRVRGRIALIKSTSGQVWGTCEVADCVGPLSLGDLRGGAALHRIPQERLAELPYPRTYAWVLRDAKPLVRPVSYVHPSGAVIWVRLPDLALQ
jgi:hypothetical protein